MTASQTPEIIKRQLASLPDSCGIYLFKDKLDNPIYIGKAVNLKHRVRSYWNKASWQSRPKLYVMMPRVMSIETIVTKTEKEALLLESNLIRKHLPRYNVHLKDDKRYPWLAITYDEPFPRLIMVRDPARYRKDNPRSKVFGPYVETGAMWQTVKILRKVFPMRQRKTPLFKDRPCMNYQIGLCLGPCQNLVEEEPYDRMVKQVEMFLSGQQAEVMKQLKQDMEAASEALDFEKAARLRDGIAILKKVIEKQQVIFENQSISQDIISYASTERHICFCLLKVRQGKLNSSETMLIPLPGKTSVTEAFQSFVDQYYTQCDDVALPREVLVAEAFEDSKVLEELLTTRRGGPVRIVHPRRGQKLTLIQMAGDNAENALKKELEEKEVAKERTKALVGKLKEELGLTGSPHLIECFDISNMQGTDTVASMVVFEGGRPAKSKYRRYKVRSTEGKPDDFQSMKEVVERRYKRLVEKEGQLPDLIVIDGGKGQLSAAMESLEKLGIKNRDIIGLAKKREEIFKPGLSTPVLLPRQSEALHVLQQARDEAHRFAITYHRKLRARRVLRSDLDKIPGVGKTRRQKLINHFGSVDKIKTASLEEIAAVPGLPRNIAEKIFANLNADKDSRESQADDKL